MNVGSKLLILPVYDEWNFFGETLDVYELHCDATVVKQNIMPPSIIKQCFQCRFFPTLVVVNHRNQLYQKNMKITLEILNLLNMDLGFVEYSFDFDYECTYIKVFQSFNYIVVSTERSRKKCLPNFILILEMKKIEEQRYELIEVNRLNLKERLAMNGNFRVENVISNANKGKVLFHTITDKVIKDLQHIKIYDVSKQDFIDSIFFRDKLCEVIISYVNHNERQDGVVICFYLGKK